MKKKLSKISVLLVLMLTLAVCFAFGASAEETTYTVKTFVGNNLVNTVTKNALVGQTVTENPSEVQGYTLDTESSSLSGTVYANGKLTLSVVYQENSEIENYRLANGGF